MHSPCTLPFPLPLRADASWATTISQVPSAKPKQLWLYEWCSGAGKETSRSCRCTQLQLWAEEHGQPSLLSAGLCGLACHAPHPLSMPPLPCCASPCLLSWHAP
jgi:hypothetical protein